MSSHLFSLWAKHIWIEVLIILHWMSKYILSESLLDQQYRTIDTNFKVRDHFCKHCIRSTLHQFLCPGGSIFFEGDVFKKPKSDVMLHKYMPTSITGEQLVLWFTVILYITILLLFLWLTSLVKVVSLCFRQPKLIPLLLN